MKFQTETSQKLHKNKPCIPLVAKMLCKSTFGNTLQMMVLFLRCVSYKGTLSAIKFITCNKNQYPIVVSMDIYVFASCLMWLGIVALNSIICFSLGQSSRKQLICS